MYTNTITLVLNLSTRYVIPKFYITFDDELSAVTCIQSSIKSSNEYNLIIDYTKYLEANTDSPILYDQINSSTINDTTETSTKNRNY